MVLIGPEKFRARLWHQLLQNKSINAKDDDNFSNGDYPSESSDSDTNFPSSDSEADAVVDALEVQELAKIPEDDQVRSDYGSSTDEENDPATRLADRVLHKNPQNTLRRWSLLPFFSADMLCR